MKHTGTATLSFAVIVFAFVAFTAFHIVVCLCLGTAYQTTAGMEA